MRVCAIIHNMTAWGRKAIYTGTRASHVGADVAEAEDVGTKTYQKLNPQTDPIALVERMHEVAGQV